MQRGAILGQAACGVGIARYFLVAFVAAAPLPSRDSWCVSQQLLAFIPAWLPTFQEQLWYKSPCKHHTLVSLSEYLGNACKILQVGQSVIRSSCLPLRGHGGKEPGSAVRVSQQHSSSVAIGIPSQTFSRQ